MLVFCFADRAHADQFRVHFGGNDHGSQTAAQVARVLYPACLIKRFGADCPAAHRNRVPARALKCKDEPTCRKMTLWLSLRFGQGR
jgi:hypothetical protein